LLEAEIISCFSPYALYCGRGDRISAMGDTYVAWLFRAAFLAFVASIFGSTKEEIGRRSQSCTICSSRECSSLFISRGHSSLFSYSMGSQAFLFVVTLGTTRKVLENPFPKNVCVSSRCGLLFEPHFALKQLRSQRSSGRVDFWLQSKEKILGKS